MIQYMLDRGAKGASVSSHLSELLRGEQLKVLRIIVGYGRHAE
jgi:hypothetical protein